MNAPAGEILTERLRLRRVTESDIPSLYEMDCDPDVMRYIWNLCPPECDTFHEFWVKRIHSYDDSPLGYWIVEYRDAPGFIGWVTLKPLDQSEHVEIGYRLMKADWGKGIATEASLPILDYGFNEAGLDEIVAVAHPGNGASRRVLEKLGLHYDGMAFYYKADVVYYSLSRTEYLKSAGASTSAQRT